MIEPTGVPLPERSTNRLPRIIHVPWKQEVECVFLNHAWHGEEIHFDETLPPHGRDQPCRLPLECRYCREADKRRLPRFNGFCGVLALNGHPSWLGRCVLSLPFLLAKNLQAFLSRKEGLRGVWFRFVRSGNKRNDSVEIVDYADYGKAIPPAFDVRPCLEIAWGLADYYRQKEAEMSRKNREDAHERVKIARGTA